MRILVQKYGGTSLATQEQREIVTRRIEEALKEGYKVVVVVSAMGRQGDPYATDTLKSFAQDICPDIPSRELDLIMSCGEIISAVALAATLNKKGISSRALTGPQAGFNTDGYYSEAEVLDCQPLRVEEALQNNEVPIIAGFQGADACGEINTLGRGGKRYHGGDFGCGAYGRKGGDIYRCFRYHDSRSPHSRGSKGNTTNYLR